MRTLGREGLRVETAKNGEEGLRRARQLRPALITLDVMMPSMDGWAVLTALKADPELRSIPVIMLTIMDQASLGYALNATDYLTKPIDREQLVTLVQKYRQTDRSASAQQALVIEDDPNTREVLRRTLEREGWLVSEAADGRLGLAQLSHAIPNVILLDLMMPEMDGFSFVAELRSNPTWRTIPVVVITAMDLTAEERQRLNGSVQQIFQKGAYDRDDLLRQVRTLVGQSLAADPSAVS